MCLRVSPERIASGWGRRAPESPMSAPLRAPEGLRPARSPRRRAVLAAVGAGLLGTATVAVLCAAGPEPAEGGDDAAARAGAPVAVVPAERPTAPRTAWSRATPPATLAETGLYADPETRTLAPGVRPYTPQYPLWTDGARKTRWLWLPPGTRIDATAPGAWVFPVGTRLWKEFALERRVETRYLERRDDGWMAVAYVWDADGREARRAPDRGVRGAARSASGAPYDVPARADCRACHDGPPTPVLGVSALQLSPDRDPLAPHAEIPGPDHLDLAALVREGLVVGVEAGAEAPRIDAPTPRGRAALGYLHANCGACHNATSPLASLDLRLDATPGLASPLETLATVVARESRFRVAASSATPATVRVVPGRPHESVLFRRLASRDPSVQMPPLGTRVVDEAGAALIEAWIREDLAAVPSFPLSPLSPPSPPSPLSLDPFEKEAVR